MKPDGSPHVTPVWHQYDGNNLIILAEESAVKIQNIRHEPRVSVSIATDTRPYKYVLINGTATLSHDNIREYVLAMAINYLGQDEGEEYTEKAVRDLDFVVITIKPTKIISWQGDD